MNNLGIAFELMIIGMTVVFINLYLVVLLGNWIIKFINRFVPETSAVIPKNTTDKIISRKFAAIESAVNIVTNGKGKVTHVEKISANR